MNSHWPKLMLALGIGALCYIAFGQPVPPVVTNVQRHIFSTTPKTTRVLISWDADTNAYTEIEYTTNIDNPNWQHYTNVPIWQTQAVIQSTNANMFFRTRNYFINP